MMNGSGAKLGQILPKYLPNLLKAVLKYPLQLLFNIEFVQQVTHKPEGYPVMNDIRHFHPAGNLPEMMLVVPEGIGAKTLLIDKKSTVRNMGDLGHPVHGDTRQRAYLVLNDLTGVHGIAMVAGNDPEIHSGGSDGL